MNTLGKVLEIMIDSDADVGRFYAKVIPETTADYVFDCREDCAELSVSETMPDQEYVA